MATDRRQKLLLGVLGVVLVALAVYQFYPAPSATPAQSSNRQVSGARGTGRAEQQGSPTTPDVHLEALEAEKPKPTGPDRNLFRYKPKPPPPPPAPPPTASAPS